MMKLVYKIKRRLYKPILDMRQKRINNDFEFYGHSDELLEKQIALNEKRHELDLPDKSSLDDEGYVQ